MADYRRMLVVENAEMITIQDDTGLQANFSSFEDCLKYTGHDFTGKFYIGYEPEINFFTDSKDPEVTPEMIPYAPYEDLITNIQLYLDRQADEYYGMDEETKTEAARTNAYQRLWDYNSYWTESEGESVVEDDKPKKDDKDKAAKETRKLNKALRKEANGTANADDIKLLDDNDAITDWMDEVDEETEGDDGEGWIENNNRTFEELENYNPETAIEWPPYPEL